MGAAAAMANNEKYCGRMNIPSGGEVVTVQFPSLKRS